MSWCNCIEVLKDLLKNIDHLFLGDAWEKFGYKCWNVDNIPWIEQEQNKIKVTHLTFVLYSLHYHSFEPVALSPQCGCSTRLTWSDFVWSPHHRSCFTRQVLANHHPAVSVTSQPLCRLLLFKFQILPNLSALLGLIPQVVCHLIFCSGYKSWQPQWHHT